MSYLTVTSRFLECLRKSFSKIRTRKFRLFYLVTKLKSDFYNLNYLIWTNVNLIKIGVLFFSCNQLFFGILKYAPLNFLWSSKIRLIFVRASIHFLDFSGEEINLFSFYQTLYIIYSNQHLFLFPEFSPLFYFSFLKSNGLSPSIVFLFFCFPTLILLPWALSK